MTTTLRLLLLAMAVFLSASSPAFAGKKNEGQLVRISKNRDGSSTEFKRNPDNTVLRKTTYVKKANGEKVVRTFTLYRRDKYGNLRSGSIHDGKNNKLFRVVYGYHIDTGRLIAENMYDARVRRTRADDPTKEEPVRATRYHYDSQGKRSAPMVFTSQAGKTSDQLMNYLDRNKPASDVDADPFRKIPVNPNAKPVGR